jgi:hypothetical protein
VDKSCVKKSKGEGSHVINYHAHFLGDLEGTQGPCFSTHFSSMPTVIVRNKEEAKSQSIVGAKFLSNAIPEE